MNATIQILARRGLIHEPTPKAAKAALISGALRRQHFLATPGLGPKKWATLLLDLGLEEKVVEARCPVAPWPRRGRAVAA